MIQQDIRLAVFFSLFLILAILIPPVQAQNNSHINMTVNGKHTYQVNKDGYDLEFEMKGDIEFNDTDTDVVSISRGGYLEMSEKTSRTRHQLRIEGLSGGRLEYRYKLNGRKTDFARVDRDWYEDMLITMIRETGAGAEQRTARILKNDSVEGVFDEIHLIESSGSRMKYMTHLFDQAKLNDAQLQRAAKMAREIPSSGDRSRFLTGSAAQFLESDEATPYFFDAVESIPSSGDKTRVLSSLVDNDLLQDRESYLEAIRVAKSIPSSGDRSRFLMTAADLYIEEASDLYFEAVGSIPSSGDKTRVLMKLVEKDALTNNDSYDDAMEIAKGIPSSGDRARFLMAAAKTYHGGARGAYFNAVSSLPSSGDHARVLINLADNVTLDRASMISFLKSARGISSSGDKTRVLTSVADDVAGDESLVEAYIETVETISSSGDYKRALSALMN